MLNEDYLDKIINKIESVAEENHVSEANIPAQQVTKELTNTVFQTSLSEEEGHHVHPSIVFIPPEKLEELVDSREIHLSSFQERIPFTSHELTKLSPAFQAEDAYIAVTSEDYGDLYMVGGFFHVVLGRLEALELTGEAIVLDFLTICANSPGSLKFTLANRVIGRLGPHGFIPAKVTFIDPHYPIGSKILDRVESHIDKADSPEEYEEHGWRFYQAVLLRILLEASSRGHGGTVTWVPQNCNCDIESRIDHGYDLADSPHFGILRENIVESLCHSSYRYRKLRDTEEAESQKEGLNKTKKRAQRYCEFVAQLTTIDGALILDDRFNVLSFGSFFKDQGNTPSVVDDEFNEVNLDRYGTRHNSAVQFASTCPEAIVFVISEDGPIAGITQLESGQIYWWPDCSASLFAHD